MTHVHSPQEGDNHSVCTEDASLGYYHWINFVFITTVATVGEKCLFISQVAAH